MGPTAMLSDLGEPHFHRPPFPGLSIYPFLSSLRKLVVGILFLREHLERMLLSERNAPGHSASSWRKLLGSGGAFPPTCRSLVCEDTSECASLSCRFRHCPQKGIPPSLVPRATPKELQACVCVCVCVCVCACVHTGFVRNGPSEFPGSLVVRT